MNNINSHVVGGDNRLNINSADPLHRKTGKFEGVVGHGVRQRPRAEVLELGHPVHHSTVLSRRHRVLPENVHQHLAHLVVRYHSCR